MSVDRLKLLFVSCWLKNRSKETISHLKNNIGVIHKQFIHANLYQRSLKYLQILVLFQILHLMSNKYHEQLVKVDLCMNPLYEKRTDHWILNDLLKYFTTNWNEGSRSIVYYKLIIIFFSFFIFCYFYICFLTVVRKYSFIKTAF